MKKKITNFRVKNPKDGFNLKMDQAERTAKEQGYKTKREKAAFVMGFVFGIADTITIRKRTEHEKEKHR